STNKFQAPLWRTLVVYALLIGVVGVLTSRLLALQVFSEQTWNDQAVDNYTNTLSDPSARGIIYDRNGQILARNFASYNVVITPAGLPDDDADIQHIYRELSALIDVPAGGPVTDESLNQAKLFAPCVAGLRLRIWSHSVTQLHPIARFASNAILVKNLPVSLAKDPWIGPAS